MNLSTPFCIVCGKERYPSEEAATAAARSYARKGHHRTRRLPVRAYRCRSGNGWHLTSRNTR